MERRYASIPAVCGEAMDVPEMVLTAVGLPAQVDLMLRPTKLLGQTVAGTTINIPGANTSTQLP
jgi:hypothetical protein